MKQITYNFNEDKFTCEIANEATLIRCDKSKNAWFNGRLFILELFVGEFINVYFPLDSSRPIYLTDKEFNNFDRLD
jgi:hypothetical protein